MAQQSQGQAALTALYVWAETTILGGLASIVRRMLPGLQGRYTAARQIRQLSRAVDARLAQDTPALVDETIAEAVAEGEGATVPPVPPEPPMTPDGVPEGPAFDFTYPKGDRAADAVRADLTSELADVRKRITRLEQDVYQTVVGENAILHTSAGLTPQQAQQAAWQELTRRGVTGFTDKSGRDWSLSSYVEMAVRTAYLRAVNDAATRVILASGVRLGMVTADGHPCPLCQPWEYRVLALVPDGVHPTPDDARAAGLWHPNCKHALVAVTDPARVPAPREWTPEDAARYKATQRLRALERAVRQAKQVWEYAPDPDARRQARKDVRAAQARIRQFLASDAGKGLLRRSRREQPQLSLR